MANRVNRPLGDSYADHNAIWQRALQTLRDSIDHVDFNEWLADTHAIEVRGGVLHVGVPNVFVLETIRARYYPAMASAVREAAGRSMEIELRVASLPEYSAEEPDIFSSEEPSPTDGRSQPIQPARTRPYLQPKLKFERFIEGATNQIAHAAARRVAWHPGEDINPLFIYASSGLGKTHLLTAIGHVLVRTRYTKFVNAEDYVRGFVNAVKSGRRPQFQEEYESADALVIDDVQELAKAVQTQDEFFNVFNELHSRGRQIVIASDQPPRLLTGLSERLVTRFHGGLVVEINPPDFELRIAILQRKAVEMGLEIDDALFPMIAQRAVSDVRELMGMLNRLRIASETEQSPITPALVTRALAGYTPQVSQRAKPTIPDLIAATADVTGVSPELFTAKRKDRRTAGARQIVMYLATQHTELSLSQIGEALGGRDHSTVLHGRDKVKNLLTDPTKPGAQSWVEHISAIRARLRLSP